MPPQFLVIGHVTRDLVRGRFTLGGTASYAALTASRLGRRVALLTSAGPELALDALLPGVTTRYIPTAETTTFQNLYEKGQRRQLLLARAAPINVSDLPPTWRSCPIVLLGPVIGEVSPQLAHAFRGALLGASLQGWLRGLDATGHIQALSGVPLEELLSQVQVAFVSEKDLAHREEVEPWARQVPALALTLGRKGSLIHWRGQWHAVPAFPALEVDPTGAGDVFATAFLTRYAETRDALDAARFASCAASFCVEAEGLAGVPSLSQVARRLRAPYPEEQEAV